MASGTSSRSAVETSGRQPYMIYNLVHRPRHLSQVDGLANYNQEPTHQLPIDQSQTVAYQHAHLNQPTTYPPPTYGAPNYESSLTTSFPMTSQLGLTAPIPHQEPMAMRPYQRDEQMYGGAWDDFQRYIEPQQHAIQQPVFTQAVASYPTAQHPVSHQQVFTSTQPPMFTRPMAPHRVVQHLEPHPQAFASTLQPWFNHGHVPEYTCSKDPFFSMDGQSGQSFQPTSTLASLADNPPLAADGLIYWKGTAYAPAYFHTMQNVHLAQTKQPTEMATPPHPVAEFRDTGPCPVLRTPFAKIIQGSPYWTPTPTPTPAPSNPLAARRAVRLAGSTFGPVTIVDPSSVGLATEDDGPPFSPVVGVPLEDVFRPIPGERVFRPHIGGLKCPKKDVGFVKRINAQYDRDLARILSGRTSRRDSD